MGFKCGNCGSEFQNYKQLVAHMAIVHGSFFEEGDENWVNYSQSLKAHPTVTMMQAIASGNLDNATQIMTQAAISAGYVAAPVQPVQKLN